MRIVSIFFALVSLIWSSLSIADSQITNRCIEAISSNSAISDHLLDLMQRQPLIKQTDARLAKRNLRVAGGGLCTSTCGVNALVAMASFVGLDPTPIINMSDEYIEQIVNRVRDQFGYDARRGLGFLELAPILQDFAYKLKPSMRMTSYALDIDSGDSISVTSLQTRRNEIILFSANAFYNRDYNLDLNHALILLKIDAEKRLIHYLDPNYSNLHFVSRFKIVNVGNKATIQLSDISHFSKAGIPRFGTVNQILKIKIQPLN